MSNPYIDKCIYAYKHYELNIYIHPELNTDTPI